MNEAPQSSPAQSELQRRIRSLKYGPSPQTASELARLEARALALGRRVADEIVAFHLMRVHEDEKFINRVVRAFRQGTETPYRGHGKVHVEVRLAGGGRVELQTPYQIIDRRNFPGRKRAPGNRGETGTGRFPLLEQLGVSEKASPRVRYLTAYQLVTGDSYRSSLEVLEQQGLDLDNKALVRIGRDVASDLIAHRDERLEALAEVDDRSRLPLAGRKVLVSIDGGRVRLRYNNTRGRRKKNGRRGFTTEWKEPKGFIIECLTDEGTVDRKSLPFIDFTLGDADALFSLLRRYLLALGADQAAQLVVVADGADWIWNRVQDLMTRVGVRDDRLMKLLDFYHAAEHLAEATKACTGMSETERRELFEQLRGWLRDGNYIYLTARLGQLAIGRRAKPIKKVLAYLEARKHLLGYAAARKAGLPIGSGAIESAIRRVLNLRFKSAGTVWSAEHFEPLLHMRALVKTGRFDLALSALLDDRTLLRDNDVNETFVCPFSTLGEQLEAA